MIIKCPYCGVYIEPFLRIEDGYIFVVCLACGTELTGRDLEGDDEEE